MRKSDPAASKKERAKTARWVVSIFGITILVSGIISLASDVIMESSGIFAAFVIYRSFFEASGTVVGRMYRE